MAEVRKETKGSNMQDIFRRVSEVMEKQQPEAETETKPKIDV